MRKCIRCTREMVENLDVKVEGGAYGLKITKQGIFTDNLGKVSCAVCPKCGYYDGKSVVEVKSENKEAK